MQESHLLNRKVGHVLSQDEKKMEKKRNNKKVLRVLVR